MDGDCEGESVECDGAIEGCSLTPACGRFRLLLIVFFVCCVDCCLLLGGRGGNGLCFCVVRASQGVSGSIHPLALSEGIIPCNKHSTTKMSLVEMLGKFSCFATNMLMIQRGVAFC